jgi:hypothetical protein
MVLVKWLSIYKVTVGLVGLYILEFKFLDEEVKNRLNLGNASYQLIQNLLASGLVSTNLKIKM